MKVGHRLLGIALSGGLASCAVMHRSTIGERLEPGDETVEVDVISSAIGFDREGASRIASDGLKGSGSSAAQSLGAFIAFVSWATTQSPRTGEPTATDDWAEEGIPKLRSQCVGGALTGIQVVRESAKYPLVSGEIVRVRGQCLKSRPEEATHASN